MFIELIIPGFKNFVFFTLFFWFLSENILIDMASFAVEMRLLITPKGRNLETNISLVTISFLWILLKLAIYIYLMIVSTKKTSFLFFLHNGLKPGRVWLIIYYSHYLIVRLLYAFLVFFTSQTHTKVVMFLLLFTQLASLLLNFVKLYSSKLLYFQTLTTWEFNLLIDISILIAI